MSSTAGVPQELVVDGALADELERRGVHVHAGDRVQLRLVPGSGGNSRRSAAWRAFVGGSASGDPHLADRSEEILRAELGR